MYIFGTTARLAARHIRTLMAPPPLEQTGTPRIHEKLMDFFTALSPAETAPQPHQTAYRHSRGSGIRRLARISHLAAGYLGPIVAPFPFRAVRHRRTCFQTAARSPSIIAIKVPSPAI